MTTGDSELPELERARREAIRHHDAIRDAGMMKRVGLAEYRCRKGCLLLAVWNSPGGPEFYADTTQAEPFYMMALAPGCVDVRGQDRNEAGAPRFGIPDIWAGRLDDHPAEGWLPLICDHYQGTVQLSAVHDAIRGRKPGAHAPVTVDAATRHLR